MYINFSKLAKTLKVFGTTMVPPWYHHFFKISYIAGNGDGFTVNIPRGWYLDILIIATTVSYKIDSIISGD